MPKLIGRAEDIELKYSKTEPDIYWLVRVSLKSRSQGTVWMSAKKSDVEAFCEALISQKDLAENERTLWEVEYEIDDTPFKNKNVLNARAVAPDEKLPPVGTSEDDDWRQKNIRRYGAVEMAIMATEKVIDIHSKEFLANTDKLYQLLTPPSAPTQEDEDETVI